MDPEDDTVGYLATRVADALGQQAELHIELVKAEIARDAKSMARDAQALGRDVTPLALGIPLLGVGYVFVCVALALALAPLLGAAGGLAVVGTVNLLGAGFAFQTSVSRLRVRRDLRATLGATGGATGGTTFLSGPPTELESPNV